MREDLTKATNAATLTQQSGAQLLKRAQAGDKTALSDLRRLLDDSPGLWNELGDLAMQVTHSLIELAGGLATRRCGYLGLTQC